MNPLAHMGSEDEDEGDDRSLASSDNAGDAPVIIVQGEGMYQGRHQSLLSRERVGIRGCTSHYCPGRGYMSQYW